MKSIVFASVLALSLNVSAGGKDDPHPLLRDKTGIAWIPELRRTREIAKERQHMMLLVTIAGGTTAAGDW